MAGRSRQGGGVSLTMSNSFTIGDVVILKSGGPAMTVENVGRDSRDRDLVWCCWFDKTDKKVGTFPVEAVESAE